MSQKLVMLELASLSEFSQANYKTIKNERKSFY